MRFSVVICTHNRSALLPRALEALERQSMPPSDWEIVVVDNASADSTADVIEAFARTSSVPVRYLHEPKLGKSIALNRGAASCAGELIALTDDDACPREDWLQRLDEDFRASDADWVFGKVEPVWDGNPPGWFAPCFNGYFALLDYGPDPFFVTSPEQPFFGVNCACRRPSLFALGGYREGFGPKGSGGGVGEDTEIFVRSLARGMRILYDPKAVVGHIIPARRATRSHQRRKVWVGSDDYYRLLRDRVRAVPWLLGLPRYFYRLALDDAAQLTKGFLNRDPVASFYHELRLIRFVALMYRASRRRAQLS